uniref:Uncharacterized protein n=1 Tax=Anguilla anguilla TaxID=7936 RepID=A0A0E9VGE7_ANGAN
MELVSFWLAQVCSRTTLDPGLVRLCGVF